MSSVIVLTKRHYYWGERSLKDVLRLYFRGKIEVLKADESKIIRTGISKSGATFKMPAPLVVKLLDFVGYKIKNEKFKYSDAAVFERDRNICQYWHYNENGKKFKYKCTSLERTIDHIVPVSRGGRTSFENCVCACKGCNIGVKKNRLPKEAKLELIKQPRRPRLIKGDMAVLTFSFDPTNKAHRALYDYLGVQFSHVAGNEVI